MKVLILDAANANSLAIVKYLGIINEIELDVVGYHKASLAFFSKYISQKYILPNPVSSQDDFLKSLLKLLKDTNYDLLIPVGFQTHKICSDYRNDILKYTHIVIPNKDSFNLASNKRETYQLAERIEVPYPKTYHVVSVEELEKIEISFPVVIKAPLELGRSLVEYANSPKELKEKFIQLTEALSIDKSVFPIVQEYIKGEGYGFFAFYNEGKCESIFMHKRIREYPASGGASVCAESFYDETLLCYGKKMLDTLKWNGVAMVEFKKDIKDDTYKLMEINPKFWGSLQLALAAGVNFPLCLIKKIKNEKQQINLNYKRIRFHWVLNGEIFHVISKPSSFFAILKDLIKAQNDIDLKDPIPNIIQLLMIFLHYYKKLKLRFYK